MDVVKHLKPLFVMLQVFGILPCKIKKTKSLYVIVDSENHIKYVKIVFVMFVVSNVVLFPFYFAFTKSRMFLHGSSKILIVSGVFIFHASVTLLLSLVLNNAKVIRFWINTVNVICDHRLPRSEVKALVRVITFLVAGTLFNSATLFCGASFHYLEVNRSHFEKAERFLVFLGLSALNFFTKLFLMFVLFIRLYYKHLNGIIVNLKAESSGNESFLKMIKELVLEDMFIKDLLDFLHRVFIPPITVHLLWFFDLMLYNIVCTGRPDIWVPLQIIWAFYICWEAFSIIITCQMTINEAGKTLYHLHQLCIENDDASLKEEVEIYSLQIQHKKIEFDGCGFFTIDCPLLYTAVGVFVTYIVILVELQTKSKSIPVCHCNGTNMNA